MAEFEIIVPSVPRQEMVKTTGPESATVEAPPEVVEPEKLPSEDDSVQALVWSEVQKIVVRPPIETLAGRAQIFAVACGIPLPVGGGVVGGGAT